MYNLMSYHEHSEHWAWNHTFELLHQSPLKYDENKLWSTFLSSRKICVLLNLYHPWPFQTNRCYLRRYEPNWAHPLKLALAQTDISLKQFIGCFPKRVRLIEKDMSFCHAQPSWKTIPLVLWTLVYFPVALVILRKVAEYKSPKVDRSYCWNQLWYAGVANAATLLFISRRDL